MDNFNIFLLFPVDSIENAINCEEDYQAYMDAMCLVIDRADCEKGAKLYYQGSNKDNCIDQLTIINDCDFYLQNPELIINILLENAEDWEEYPKNSNDCVYRIWDIESDTTISLFPASIKEVGEYILREQHKCLLVNIDNCFSFNRPFIPLFKDSRNIVSHQPLRQFVHIEYVANFTDIEKWFEYNRQQRQLNITDQRHNEQSPNYIRGKSPILYDFRHSEQQQVVRNLLNTAITDQRSRERESKDLMNYDHTKERYIWFEYQNASNEFHAYHLAKPRTHERDENAEKNIPKRVLDILKVRKIVSQSFNTNEKVL